MEGIIRPSPRFVLAVITAVTLVLPLAALRNGKSTLARIERDAGDPLEGDNPREAFEWRLKSMVSQDGRVRGGALMRALAQRNENAAHWRSGLKPESAGVTRTSWTSIGPPNIGGRTRTLLVDPTDPNILWAGAVGGGVWKSTDAGSSWIPACDYMSSLAVCCMAMDPANNKTMYCGTGEGFFNYDAITGAGMFKTTDGGLTWNQLSSTANWQSVNRIAICPGNTNLILAAQLYGGIQRSTDGGKTWSNRRSAQGSFDVLFHPSDPNKAIAHIVDYDFSLLQWFHSALYSTDAGLSWSPSSLNNISGFRGRIELAYAGPNSSTAYALFDDGGGGKLYRSTDGGSSYSPMTISVLNDLGRFEQTLQGNWWYDNVIWVSPMNPDVLVVGGADLFKSTDAGRSFVQITAFYSLHPDQHAIVVAGGFNGIDIRGAYVCNDGGIFRTDDLLGTAIRSNWTSLNSGYQTTQFYGVAGNGATGIVIGGTQDNGALRSSLASVVPTTMISGDGGYCAVDPTDDTYCFSEYVGLQIYRSVDHGYSANPIWGGITDVALGNAPFIGAFTLDPNDSNRMLAGAKSLWVAGDVRFGDPPGWTPILAPDPGGKSISAIAVAPGNSDVVWVGREDGKVVRTANGTAASPTWIVIDDNAAINPLPDRYITRIVIDPLDAQIVYLAFGGFESGNLQRTTDGGATWSDLTGTGLTALPQAPIRGLAMHPTNPNWLYAGTQVGVFTSEDGGRTWSTSNEGPSGAAIDELTFMSHSLTLVAATHGRGLWSVDLSAAPVRPVPDIIKVTIAAKDLYITGENFEPGAVILVNGIAQRTRNVHKNPTTLLIGPKLLKKLTKGQTVSLQVLNPDTTISASYPFVRPIP
jgi:photosystem II stability/assembly factor-like uncharacterized protein